MDKQRETARKSRKVSNYMGADSTIYEDIDTALTSRFIGYDKVEASSDIIAITAEYKEGDQVTSELVDVISEGTNRSIITAETPL